MFGFAVSADRYDGQVVRYVPDCACWPLNVGGGLAAAFAPNPFRDQTSVVPGDTEPGVPPSICPSSARHAEHRFGDRVHRCGFPSASSSAPAVTDSTIVCL